jgi:hypothetical protein
MDLQFVVFLTNRILESVPNPTLTGFLFCVGAGLIIQVSRIIRRVHDMGRFDLELWNRVVSLVQENRLRDASVLCEIEEGSFPRMYKAGIDAARFSRQDSGDNMTLVIQEERSAMRRGLGSAAAASLIVIGVSVAAALHRLMEHSAPLTHAAFAPMMEALLYISYPVLVGLALVAPPAAGAIYCGWKILRLSSRMNTHRLRLLVALFERVARNSMDPFAGKFLSGGPTTVPAAEKAASQPVSVPAAIPEETATPERTSPPEKPAAVAFPSRAGLQAEEADVWNSVNRRS